NRRVEVLHQAKSNPDREWPHPLTMLPDLPAAPFSEFKVLGDERIVDMREWRLNPTDDPNLDGFVVYQNKRDLLKIAPTNEMRVETRTSGRDAIMRGMRPNPTKVRALSAEKPGFVGTQAMKVRQLVFDVSDIPVNGEFTVQFNTTY